MSDWIAVLSKDDIRKRIIGKALEYNGITAKRYESLKDEPIDALKDLLVVIFDPKDYGSLDKQWIKNAFSYFNGYVLFLGDYAAAANFNINGVKEEFCLSGPLDPEMIVNKVKQTAVKIGRGQQAQASALQEIDKELPASQSSDTSLLDALKSALGLKIKIKHHL
ncbi:hypothetical protein MCHI_000026 [Candidatus Magnetoovum chiemensis]|nr:hypothetical protein MCHI_000026 [Candidatus Magnetoovum chiemensis]